MAVTVCAVSLAACASQNGRAPGKQAERAAAPISGSFPAGEGRSLEIDCAGSGPVTVVLEVGFDAAGTSGEWTIRPLRERLSWRYRVCPAAPRHHAKSLVRCYF